MNPDNVNQLRPRVGDIDGKAMMRWDPATLCSPKCVIYDDCPYTKKEGKKCGLEVTYLNTIYANIVDAEKGIADIMNDFELQRVGLHLMPLYQQLIRLKKEAFAIGQLVYETKKGTLKVHPVFAEIRAVIKDITKEMKEIGLNEKWEKKFGMVKNITRPGMGELMDPEKGDPGYYDSISE